MLSPLSPSHLLLLAPLASTYRNVVLALTPGLPLLSLLHDHICSARSFTNMLLPEDVTTRVSECSCPPHLLVPPNASPRLLLTFELLVRNTHRPATGTRQTAAAATAANVQHNCYCPYRRHRRLPIATARRTALAAPPAEVRPSDGVKDQHQQHPCRMGPANQRNPAAAGRRGRGGPPLRGGRPRPAAAFSRCHLRMVTESVRQAGSHAAGR